MRVAVVTVDTRKFGTRTTPIFARGKECQRDARRSVSGRPVKTQSMCFHTSDGRGNRQRHVVRWIAISLSVEDQARLAAEPHLFGNFSNCKCFGGVDETDLCMHL